MVLSAPERITRLIEVAAALSKTMTPEQVAEVVTTKGLAALGARGGALLRRDDEAGDYVLHASTTESRGRSSACRKRLTCRSPSAREASASGRTSACVFRPHPRTRDRGHCARVRAGRAWGPRRRVSRATVEYVSAPERAGYALERVRREGSSSQPDEGRLSGIVSHELRTPVGHPRMGADQAGMITSPRPRARSKAIERNASLQARLVDDLLDVSRIVGGKLALDVTPVRLAPIVNAAIDSVRPSLLSKGSSSARRWRRPGNRVGARIGCGSGGPVTNAIKFTTGRVHRDRAVARRADGASRVRDTAPGSPRARARIFERLGRPTGRHARLRGLGLGLRSSATSSSRTEAEPRRAATAWAAAPR
jgi:K+-sensing histidine kinase KdpD